MAETLRRGRRVEPFSHVFFHPAFAPCADRFYRQPFHRQIAEHFMSTPIMQQKPKVRPRPSRQERAERRFRINEDDAELSIPEEPILDVKIYELVLRRRMAMLEGNKRRLWRTCDEAVCRRMRACIAPFYCCWNTPPSPPDTDGRRSANMAQMHRAYLDSLRREGRLKQK